MALILHNNSLLWNEFFHLESLKPFLLGGGLMVHCRFSTLLRENSLCISQSLSDWEMWALDSNSKNNCRQLPQDPPWCQKNWTQLREKQGTEPWLELNHEMRLFSSVVLAASHSPHTTEGKKTNNKTSLLKDGSFSAAILTGVIHRQFMHARSAKPSRKEIY